MSACQCYERQAAICQEGDEQKIYRRSQLFSWVSAALLSIWVGIVALAVELAGPENLSAAPTLEAFLRSLL